jgi:hypothetical protein
MDRMCLEISCLEIMYHGLSEETRAIITFPQYVALESPVGVKRIFYMGSS